MVNASVVSAEAAYPLAVEEGEVVVVVLVELD
jgi:hypothetical protein